MSKYKNKDNRCFREPSWKWKTSQSQDSGHTFTIPVKILSFFQNIGGVGQSCTFSPINWLFSLFTGSDPWQNWGHPRMIAHSCGLHGLDKTVQQVWKSRRMSVFCSQMANPSEWILFPSVPYLGQWWSGGNLGPVGSQEADTSLTWCLMLAPEDQNRWMPAAIALAGCLTGLFINKVKVSCTNSKAVWSIYNNLGGARSKEPACQCRRHKICGFNPWVWNIPWRRAWQCTPVFLLGESHRERSLVGYRAAKSQTQLKQLSFSR